MFKSWRPFIEMGESIILRPIIPIVIENPDTGIILRTYGLLDTGADTTLINAEFGELLGHNIEKGQESDITGLAEQKLCYEHKTIINILKDDSIAEKISYQLDCKPIAYMKDLRDIPVILGCNDFLDYFKIVLNYPRKKFSLTK